MSIRFDKPKRNEAVKETTSATQTPKTNGSGGSAKIWLIALLVVGLVVAAAGFIWGASGYMVLLYIIGGILVIAAWGGLSSSEDGGCVVTILCAPLAALCIWGGYYLQENVVFWDNLIDGIEDSPRQHTAPAATSSTAPESTYDYSSSSVPSSESSATGSSSSSSVVYDAPEPVSPYIDNRLSTGTVPYGNEYDFVGDDSQIHVTTSSGSDRDVVVIVKCNGVMVRNAYIKAGGSYTFNVPNSTYQVFFYYGKGWDPTKKMGAYKTGGFVENESFQKDSPVELEDQELSYSLILRRDGNFSTKPSNKSEIF